MFSAPINSIWKHYHLKMKSIFLIVLLAVICSSWAAVYQIEESTHKGLFIQIAERPKFKWIKIKTCQIIDFPSKNISCLIMTYWTILSTGPKKLNSWYFTDFPNQCYHDGQAFSVGVHRPEGKCYEIKCTESFAVQQFR